MNGPSQSTFVRACCCRGVPCRCTEGKTLYMFEQFEVASKLFVEVTWVSCHSDRPMWRYATLCVLSKMYNYLLFNNFSIVWNIKILLKTFGDDSPQMLCAKFRGNRWNCLGGVKKIRFATFGEFAEFCNKVYVSHKPKQDRPRPARALDKVQKLQGVNWNITTCCSTPILPFQTLADSLSETLTRLH